MPAESFHGALPVQVKDSRAVLARKFNLEVVPDLMLMRSKQQPETVNWREAQCRGASCHGVICGAINSDIPRVFLSGPGRLTEGVAVSSTRRTTSSHFQVVGTLRRNSQAVSECQDELNNAVSPLSSGGPFLHPNTI
jgi:hypothetical protein